MSGNTKEQNHLKTQIARYMTVGGILLCLLFAAAFLMGNRTEKPMIGYAVMVLAGLVFFLFTLWFLQKTARDIGNSITYMEQKFEPFLKGDFSTEIEKSAGLDGDFWNLAESAEIMRKKINSQLKESKQERAALLKSMETLKEQADRLQQQISDTSVSVKEIADSMEKISTASDQINRFSEEVRISSEHTASRMKQSEEEIGAVSVRAEGIRKEALKRKQIVKHSQLEAKDSFSRSLKAIQAVEEISGLAEKMIEMIEKTNMLSLNASIEAAKAGQAGNGFSLVADEIRKLADQSKKTTEEIQWISGEAHFAVNSLKEDSNQLLHFVDSKIISDFDFFLDMADVYGNDAENIKNIADELENIYQGFSSAAEGILEAAGQIDEAAKNSFLNIQKLKNL